MSAPDTDLDTQSKRHRGPIYGIIAVLAAVIVLFLALIFVLAADPEPRELDIDAPAADAAVID